MKLKDASTTQLSKLWDEVIRLLGIRIEKDQQKSFNDDLLHLTSFVVEEYPDVYIEEIRKAYRLAVKQELGIEVIIPALAPRYFGEIWKAYERYKGRELEQSRINRTAKAVEKERPIPTEEEQTKALEDLFCLAVERAKQGFAYYDAGNLLYDFLVKRGLLFFSEERTVGFRIKAKEELTAELTKKSNNTSLIGEVVNSSQSRISIENDQSSSIDTRAKHIAFRTLIRDIIELGMDGREYLNMDF